MTLQAMKLLAACLAALLLVACGGATENPPTVEAAEGTPWFEDVTAESGLDFVHTSGHDEVHYMPEIMAGGAALFDMDNDGDLDAYLVQSGYLIAQGPPSPGNGLYRNLGDGRFEDISGESGDAAHTGYGMGVATGDVDGDGRVDLYITNVGADVLLRNLGDGRFEDITQQAGLGNTAWGAGAVFFDMDRDGDLDLFVSTYLRWSPALEIDCYSPNGWQVFCSPQSYNAPLPDVLYRNEGDGTFTDISYRSRVAERPGNGLGVISADFDGDGWPDLFVANDGMPDHLWMNLRDGSMVEDGAFVGCAVDQEGQPKAGMGVSVADFDDDGDPDLLVCNLRKESDSLYLNDGGLFSDVTAAYGLASISEPFTRFGMGWVDFDHDGRLDLYQANGRVTRHSTPLSPTDPHAEPNLLFRGVDGGFSEVQPRGGTALPIIATSRAAAFGDLDNDGAVDILVANLDGPPHLLRNVVPQRGEWIMFSVLNAQGAPAIGARLSARIGERTVTREVRTASSYFAANDPRLHFGLATAVEVSDVKVRWPDGSEQDFGTHAAGQVVELRQAP